MFRFYMDLESSMTSFQKKQNYVRFPIQDFDVKDYVTRSAKMHGLPTVYNLCGVSNHYGTMDRGHYTAFCKNFKSNRFERFDLFRREFFDYFLDLMKMSIFCCFVFFFDFCLFCSWYKFDDNYVNRINNNEVNSSASYILFYELPAIW